MRKFFGVCCAAALFVMSANSRAEATPFLTIHVCQGGTCAADVSGSGPNIFGVFTAGDYSVAVLAGENETASGSNSQTATINVKRTGTSSSNPLDIWLTATGYVLPTGPTYVLDSTLSGTESQNFDGAPTLTYQAWLSPTNQGTPPFPPTAGFFTNGLITCSAMASGTPTSPATDSCLGNASGVAIPASGGQFSLVTRTTFNVPVSAANNTTTYTSNGQANVAAVPEPASLTLLGTGLIGLAGAARRRFGKRNS